MLLCIVLLLISQALFTLGDLLARKNLTGRKFELRILARPWFLSYILLRLPAVFCQLYVFSQIELGKTMALFGASSILLANALGIFVLKEILSVRTYVGIALAMIAFGVLAL